MLGKLTLIYAQWRAWRNQGSDILREGLVSDAFISRHCSHVHRKVVAWPTIRLGATESPCVGMSYLPATIVSIRGDLTVNL